MSLGNVSYSYVNERYFRQALIYLRRASQLPAYTLSPYLQQYAPPAHKLFYPKTTKQNRPSVLILISLQLPRRLREVSGVKAGESSLSTFLPRQNGLGKGTSYERNQQRLGYCGTQIEGIPAEFVVVGRHRKLQAVETELDRVEGGMGSILGS